MIGITFGSLIQLVMELTFSGIIRQEFNGLSKLCGKETKLLTLKLERIAHSTKRATK